MKRLAVLIVGVLLLVNFMWFLMSFWPYQRLAKMETTRNSQGNIVKIESGINKEIYKSNMQKYVSINVGVMVLGLSATFVFKNKR